MAQLQVKSRERIIAGCALPNHPRRKKERSSKTNRARNPERLSWGNNMNDRNRDMMKKLAERGPKHLQSAVDGFSTGMAMQNFLFGRHRWADLQRFGWSLADPHGWQWRLRPCSGVEYSLTIIQSTDCLGGCDRNRERKELKRLNQLSA